MEERGSTQARGQVVAAIVKYQVPPRIDKVLLIKRPTVRGEGGILNFESSGSPAPEIEAV